MLSNLYNEVIFDTIKLIKKKLIFKFDAGTSRGILREHNVYYLRIEKNGITGIGEAAPLFGLSIDAIPEFEKKISDFVFQLNDKEIIDLNLFPSIQFALETAQKDLENKGQKKIFDSLFFNLQKPIPINGLVWMNTKEHMKNQIIEKISQGFDTIKLKIGAIDFAQEIELIAYIRKEFSEKNIEIRVDANGAFEPKNALEKLKILSDFNLHSIEQPIKTNQWEAMSNLCKLSPLPIALDEELIGNFSKKEKENLLKAIEPQYIILKPTLLGGFEKTKEWINLAKEYNIKWWLTSALESNIGLNAITQFASTFDNPIKQGLGTGSLYFNNIESPLTVENGTIFYDKNKKWNSIF